MSSEISKQEYLKRYLEKDKNSERKRKKTKSVTAKANVSRLKIIHEDIDIKSINFGNQAEEDDGEEAPVIAEVIDERPLEVKLKELYESSRWKKINSDEVSQSSSAILDTNNDTESLRKCLSAEKNENLHIKQNSLKKVRHDSDGDISPPRNQGKNSRKRHDSDNDISPLRNSKHSDSDISPPRSHKQNRRNTKRDSGSDISPPRSHKKSRYNAKHDSNRDISPPHLCVSEKEPKIKSERYSDNDNSHPPHHKSRSQEKISSKRHDSDSDISPPRYQNVNKSNSQLKILSKKHDSDHDISPPRHKANKPNTHFKNSSGRYDSDSDEKLSRQSHSSRISRSNKNKCGSQKNSDSDISPPRSSSDVSHIKGKDKKLSKTMSGLKAGLQNSETLQQEVQELRKREKAQLNMLDDEISGRNADTIIRDKKTGMKRDLNKEQETKTEEDKKTKEYEQKYNKWGKGIEQAEDKLEKFKDDLYEMSKPLARYHDDEDLDKRLKTIIRDGDPMAEYIKKRKQKDVPDFPVYSGPPAPPNRFGILPGYRWDGVDRSNGFEKKYFEKINSSKAVENEAYLWSVQDM